MIRLSPLLLAMLSAPAWCAGPSPEIVREPARPQAPGVAHAVRTIPEACIRLEGMFTGDAAAPYRFTTTATSSRCQPRMRFVDFARARPSPEKGWKLNDEIRVPNAACPSQQAVVRVWRKPVAVAPPPLDAQGRARIYLQEASAQARANASAGLVPDVPLYAAEMRIEGGTCAR